jgi:hypothetical protein
VQNLDKVCSQLLNCMHLLSFHKPSNDAYYITRASIFAEKIALKLNKYSTKTDEMSHTKKEMISRENISCA